MPPQAVSFRPQTSRQARRAYQKAGGVPRLSEVELRRLQRSAELQERAARIKAHNDRAKENKRKKSEKLEREREARKRMGIPEPTKLKIGSSQLSLGAFVGAAFKKERDGTHRPELSLENCRKIKGPIPKPNPVRHAAVAPKSAESPTRNSSTEGAISHNTSISSKQETKPNPPTAPSLMPPPARPPLREVSCNPIAQPRAQSRAQPRNHDLGSLISTDWDALFDSNTQVEREISDTREKPLAATSTKTSYTAPSDLLASICTQDLEYSSPPPSNQDFSAQPDEEEEDYVVGCNDKELALLSVLHPEKEVKEGATHGQPANKPRIDLAGRNVMTGRLKVQTMDTRIFPIKKEGTESKPIDEFDDFDVSSQELRELDV
ncbi:MAG: hypothetical protein L6R39_002721 [Caloplaca ligustica]|nr:MAG: hypothetical protein L6R39_002721 [Caloplaca ligustica]